MSGCPTGGEPASLRKGGQTPTGNCPDVPALPGAASPPARNRLIAPVNESKRGERRVGAVIYLAPFAEAHPCSVWTCNQPGETFQC